MMGAEAVKVLLSRVDLEALSQELKAKFKDSTGQKRIKLVRRLDIVESFRKSGNNIYGKRHGQGSIRNTRFACYSHDYNGVYLCYYNA